MTGKEMSAAEGALVRFKDCDGLTREGTLERVTHERNGTLGAWIEEEGGRRHWVKGRDVKAALAKGDE